MIEGEASKNRIAEDFCPDCKYRNSNTVCSKYLFDDAICLRFTYKSKKAQNEYEQSVLRNQAITLWLEKNKSLEEIFSYSQQKLLSVLTKKHYSQFEEARARQQELLSKYEAVPATPQPAASKLPTESVKQSKSPFPKLEPAAISPASHIFYCSKDGKEVRYRRSIKSKNFQSELKSFRNFLKKQGIEIIKEEEI